jgi:hypothetical protein
VLSGRTVFCEEEDSCRVGDSWRNGEVGPSGVLLEFRVLSHEGGFCEALLMVDCRNAA